MSGYADRRSADTWQWVEIEWTVLEPQDRSQKIPDETRRTAYRARTRGYAPGNPEIGDEVEVTTVSGRRLRGQVLSLRPGYEHSFGRPEPAWLEMQRSIRDLVKESR